MMDVGGRDGVRGTEAGDDVCDSGRAKDPIWETNETERTNDLS